MTSPRPPRRTFEKQGMTFHTGSTVKAKSIKKKDGGIKAVTIV